MSWDPNQPQPPQQPQGQPPSGPNPYDPSQPPYGQPPSGPNPYDTSPPPYGQPGYTPSQQQYTPPPANPYEQPSYMPPPANPYEQPSQYAPPQTPYGQAFGAPGPQPGYGYAPPQGTPLPLGLAIQGLPKQYLKILTKPSAQSFAEEQGKADWGIIWLQLIFTGLIGTIIGLIGTAIATTALVNTNAGAPGMAYGYVSSVFLGSTSVYSIFSVIIGFFIVVGVQYLLAKMFKGTGSFKQQAYNYLLFFVPITVVSNVLGLIPVLGGIVGIALGIYSLVLNVFAIMATHRLSGGKSTAVVLIPIAVIILLAFLCTLLIVVLFAAAIHGATTTP